MFLLLSADRITLCIRCWDDLCILRAGKHAQVILLIALEFALRFPTKSQMLQ